MALSKPGGPLWYCVGVDPPPPGHNSTRFCATRYACRPWDGAVDFIHRG